MTDSRHDLDVIRELNVRMNVEETRGTAGVDFFRDLLDQALRFRRASGAIVTRDEFLIDLANPTNRRERIEPVSEMVSQVYENAAVVSVLLHVAGNNGPTRLDGLFRNIRIFHRDGTELPWRLKIWFNDAVLGAVPIQAR